MAGLQVILTNAACASLPAMILSSFSRFLKHNHVIVVLQDIVRKLEVVKKLGKKQERPQVCHFEFVPSGNGTSLVENTVPFGT